MSSIFLLAIVTAFIWWIFRSQKTNDASGSVVNQKQSNPVQKRVRNDLTFVQHVLQRERSKQAEQRHAACRSAERDIAQTDKMTGREFEHFVADLYRDLGCTAEVTPEAGDQGADVVVTQADGIRIAIQTKRYEGAVGNSAVQEVIAGRMFYHCQRAMVITNSQFTPSARALAKKDRTIELIDRSGLSLLVAQAAERHRKP